MTKTRCGFVAVLGAPNAGKSTLMNALIGGKVSIVSPKVQTTRSIVRGIAMQGTTQIVFVDTPGIFTPEKRLERAMVSAAWEGGEEADVIMLVVDAAQSPKTVKHKTGEIITALKQRQKPGRTVLLVLNKIDQMKRDELLALSAALNEEMDFAATFMVSALNGNGTKDMLKWLEGVLPESPYLFPEDEISDMPLRLLAAEITREKLFHRLHQELPYGLTVETENWEDFDNGSIKINQIIYIARESHKPIILGKGGQTIKKIGELARTELEEMFGTRIHLKLFVKVKENWSDDPERYALWGLDPGA